MLKEVRGSVYAKVILALSDSEGVTCRILSHSSTDLSITLSEWHSCSNGAILAQTLIDSKGDHKFLVESTLEIYEN